MQIINPVPQETKYLFIDGGYLDKLCEEYSENYFNGRKVELNFETLSQDYKKTFYYDCPPPEKSDEKKEEYEKRKAQKQEFFNKLRMIDGFHVIEGYVRGDHGKSRQKGIDVSIAVDMLMHTYRRNMDRATLIAGDLDFKPLLNELVREGMFVMLWHGIMASKDLIYTADLHRAFNINTIYAFMKNKYGIKLPQPASLGKSEIKRSNEFQMLKSGKFNNGENIWLYQRPNIPGFYIVPDRQEGSNTHKAFYCEDKELLFKYCNEVMGKISWDE